ncbi:MAG: hypothetical protein OZ928_08065 [Polyangiaceae bacterium]|nr:hypothetical protein [Polyangiaceae bacterium]
MNQAEWFDVFVSATVLEWGRKQRRSVPAQPNPSNAATGRKGETHVAELLSGSDYWASLSPGSRSPADVWGLRKIGRPTVVHLPIIQVKSSRSGNPETLSERDYHDLMELVAFTRERFIAEFQREVIVSAWDAGVATRPYGLVRWQPAGHAFEGVDAERAARAVGHFQGLFLRVAA